MLTRFGGELVAESAQEWNRSQWGFQASFTRHGDFWQDGKVHPTVIFPSRLRLHFIHDGTQFAKPVREPRMLNPERLHDRAYYNFTWQTRCGTDDRRGSGSERRNSAGGLQEGSSFHSALPRQEAPILS
jgi:hypothetical protein